MTYFLMKNDFTEKIHKRFKKNEFTEKINQFFFIFLKASGKVLSAFQEDLLPATSVDEIIDVCGLMGDIPSPTSFLIEILSSVP